MQNNKVQLPQKYSLEKVPQYQKIQVCILCIAWGNKCSEGILKGIPITIWLKEDSVTLELFMIDSLNPWLVGRYFPAVGVTEKFSMNLHCPTCSFLTRPRKTLLQENRVDGVYTKSCKPMIKVQKISSLSRAEKLEDETGRRVLY
ncbi:uncharacterized protein LOC108826080 isoform X1 [Raphanus sativus]|uniref:Uncharacterized protein LOC108826080 isoform X1 n=1 Tax=Raphanus sativus TaxID=3726 RepID=A0A9W3CWA7_RAPSA|nr:uncharacterized protein LOC130505301 isoform X1 [Raphanus sativus]XP_056855880.1 uncharacterized protein LOC130505301 isoform X1 [Raphanus sativus]XP_056855881.1 uncharacterized protein LOC130505301 isoform X1 [Raphanus sativus]XP_056855882.1 uncharacterized protein LOC130505301 isoform X1 [Raphanus sativus]XP_056855883.1 uncharacterized protein LOC130505301 isoform X1 [Raphanus sativus]XP_056858770.1 uncharacterized protein LOC108826080 isoform X1 [Raphanus sativus]XP_056858771.1 uncharac